jgi:hypothetical protein
MAPAFHKPLSAPPLVFQSRAAVVVVSYTALEPPHGSKPHSKQLDFGDGDVRALASTDWRPECSGFTAPSAGFNCARQDQHEFVGWVGVDRDNRACGQARAVNGPVRDRLGERHEFDAGRESILNHVPASGSMKV